MYVRDWMAKRAALSPHKIAVVDDASGESLTYSQVNERATRLANSLRERAGVVAGDRIAVLAMNRTEVLEAFFASAKLGAILVPLNYRLAEPELRYLLEDSEPAVLLFEHEFRAIVGRLRNGLDIGICVALDSGGDERECGGDIDYAEAMAASHATPVEAGDFDPESAAMIIYTSGTTRRPKGAILSHRMIAWNSFNTCLSWGIVSSDVTTVHAPLFHTGGFNVLTLPLLHLGGTVVMMRKFDAGDVLNAIARYRCSAFFAVPTMFRLMLDAPGFGETDLSSLRFVISGGAPCPVSLIEAYQRRGIALTQGFGLTEVGPNCFKLDVEDAGRKAGSIGRPTFHSEARLVDECGHDVAEGEVGELLLKGLHVCSGYWQNSEATAAALCDGWFYTGDLARRDDEGFYYVAGRAKELIISGGENIYPAEVEAVLHTHPGVAAAALVGVPDSTWGESPAAAVVAVAGATLDAADLAGYCSERLARYKVPRHIVFVDELPLLGSGKVAKQVVLEMIERQLSGVDVTTAHEGTTDRS